MSKSLGEFFSSMDDVIEPIVALSKLKEDHKRELIDAGIIHEDPQPKWARRKRGEKRPSDKWDYGEKR